MKTLSLDLGTEMKVWSDAINIQYFDVSNSSTSDTTKFSLTLFFWNSVFTLSRVKRFWILGLLLQKTLFPGVYKETPL